MRILTRGDYLQLARLVSGLILFVFAATHFLNTALGLFSLEQMDTADVWRRAVIRSLPGTIILGAALVIHIGLALWKLANRRSFRMPAWEATQLGLGLLIPFLLFPHIVNTRIATTQFGVVDNYLYELARLWPANALLQSLLLLIVWAHGCIGIHFWLRLNKSYRAFQPYLLFLAIAVPLASLGGFMVSGRVVEAYIKDPAALAGVRQVTRWPTADVDLVLASYRTWARLGFLGVLGLVGAWIGLRFAREANQPRVAIKYTGGPTIQAIPGATLLETSRANKIPHASVCGGRARCSTCRVRIEEGAEKLPPAVFPEAVTLAAIEAPANVRLACQLRPAVPLTVTRLLRPASTGPQAVDTLEADANGTEKQLAVLYINMRAFNELTKRKLPYDVVFVLNQFFTAIGTAIRTQGGTIDKFQGDGVIAVYGHRQGVEAGCRQALRTIRAVDLALDHLNSVLAPELGAPVAIASGLHAGPLIIGRIGYGEAVDVTVVGNAVKAAIGLERIARDRRVQLVLSQEAAKFAGFLPTARPTETSVADLADHMMVFEVARGRDLDVSILAPGPGEARPPARGAGSSAAAEAGA